MPINFVKKNFRRGSQSIGGRVPSLPEVPTADDRKSTRNSLRPTTFGHAGVSHSSPNLASMIDAQASRFESADVCPTCHLPFNDENDFRRPRLLPCLHTICTECLQRAENFLYLLSKSRTHRHSWRSKAARTLIGNFVCPLCYSMSAIFSHQGIRSLPINQLILSTKPQKGILPNKERDTDLIQSIARDLYPKIKSVESLMLKSAKARDELLANVDSVERRISPLLYWHQETSSRGSGSPSPPPSPNSFSVVVSQARDELFLKVRSFQAQQMNQIIRSLLAFQQLHSDLQFLSNSILLVGTRNDVVSDELLLCLSSRLSEVGEILDKTASYPVPGISVTEIISGLTGSDATKCYADVKTPLYEKVVCEIPILVLDDTNRPASDPTLHKISGGLMMKTGVMCNGTVKYSTTLGVVIIEVVPSTSGLAEIYVAYSEDKVLQVRPSSVLVRPLVLEPEHHSDQSRLKRTSRGTRDSCNSISV